MRLSFAFVCEGTSDHGLCEHLEELCRRAGASEVLGIIPDLKVLGRAFDKSVAGQVAAALTLEPDVDLIFIHRDTDNESVAVRVE